MVEPDRHLGVVAAGRRGIAVVAAGLVGQHLAVGQLAGKQLVQGDAQGKQVALRIGQLGRAFIGWRGGLGASAHGKAPLLRVDVAGRARMQRAHGFGFAPGQGHAQIQQAQHAVFALVQVGRLDVAVNHALLVQAAQCLGHLCGSGQRLRDAKLVLAIQQLLQRFTGMPVVQQIERAGCRAAGQAVVEMDKIAGRARGLHAPGQPGFVRQHGALLRVVRTRGVQCFQGVQLAFYRPERREAALRRERPPTGQRGRATAGRGGSDLVQHIDAVVRHGRGDGQAVQHIAHFQARRNRQGQRPAIFILQGGVEQAQHAHHERRDVVL